MPTISFLEVFNFIPVVNTSVTFFSVSMYSKRMDPLFISSRMKWNFISIYFDLWGTTVFFCQNNTGLIISINSCWVFKWLEFRHSSEFCFLDFYEIIGLFSANLKQNPLTLFLSLKLDQSKSQNPSNFKGFCDFLNIND